MAFIAYLSQWGEGCDYTIACGKKLVQLKATTYDAALDELDELIRDEYGYEDRRLEYVTLYEVTNKTSYDVDELYAQIDEEEAVKEAEKAQRKAEDELRRAQARLASLKGK
jgi:division protein CdvB (Snf7/Vps24/ESCRT-III family)